jgi:hypothetical protein
MTPSIFDARRYPTLPPRLLANSRVLPNRNAILPLLPKAARIVEVGVGFGDFSRLIVDLCQPAHFVAIDLFTLHEQETIWGRSTREVFGGATHEQAYRTRFAAELEAGRMTVLAGDSAACLERLQDASVDVIYLDADHTYDGVTRDLAALRPKLRDDGWLVLNDYAPSSIGFPDMPYGVIQACHEFMVSNDWEMTHLALAWAMYCDVVLRKARAV